MKPDTERSRVSRAPARRASRPASIDPNQGYSINETSSATDTSRATLYKLISSGELRVIKRNGRTIVPGSEIVRLNTPA